MGCGGAKESKPPVANSAKGAKEAKPTGEITKAIKEGGIAASMFILDNRGKIIDHYDMDKKKLGEGSYGSVCKARHKSTKMKRAVKT
eukprot:CAMPEP_0198540216 /NCGR_PEP_ID=MMETSP1462-20131121/52156_1 /TAXON_ID=1333877 /ORGANISM="Brandtodinium nutriculum, Strain RCC3387" /LENGTH=86 /DNA_ID=CAMNT_0044270307 /DNA_START=78 /DNA_END=335 /DNA_ORIENTATION=+